MPSAISTVICDARPCSARCTADSSSGSGQLRVPSGHDHADAAAVEILRGQALRDEIADRLVVQDLVGTADADGIAGGDGNGVENVSHDGNPARYRRGFGKAAGQQTATDCRPGRMRAPR